IETLSSPRRLRKPEVLRTLRVIEFASEDRSLSSSPSHNRIEKRYQRQPHPRRKRHCPIRGKNNCENPSQALINLSLAGYIFLISHCASSGSGGAEGAILRSIESNDGSSSLSHSRISRRCSSLKPISIRAYSFGMTPPPFAYCFITASALAAQVGVAGERQMVSRRSYSAPTSWPRIRIARRITPSQAPPNWRVLPS